MQHIARLKEGGGMACRCPWSSRILQQPDRDLRVVPATLTRCNRTLLCGFATLRTDGLSIDISLHILRNQSACRLTSRYMDSGTGWPVDWHLATRTQEQVGLSIDICNLAYGTHLDITMAVFPWDLGGWLCFGFPWQRPNHPPFSDVYHSMSKMGDKPAFVVLSHCSAVLRIWEWYPTVINLGVFQFWYVTALLKKMKRSKNRPLLHKNHRFFKGFWSIWNRRFFDSGIVNKQKLPVL